MAGFGVARCGWARHGVAGQAWQGVAKHGVVWLGRLGVAGQGVVWQGAAWQAGLGWAGRGKAWLGRLGLARLGTARRGGRGMAGRGLIRRGVAWQAGLGMARPGLARPGLAGMVRSNRKESETNMHDLRAELKAIRDANGTLTRQIVVDTAKDPGHPLHHRFEWDDTIAGAKYRLVQAGELLRVAYQPDPEKPTHLRAFVNYKGENSPTSEYVPTEEVLADPFAAKVLLGQMRREWLTYKRRYEHMAEFWKFIRSQTESEAS